MSLSGQRVWVLGCGYLGRALAEACRTIGAQVLSVDFSPTTGPDLCADFSAPDTLAQMKLRAGLPDLIFCCQATHGGSLEDYRRCYVEPLRLLAADGLVGKCVMCSSTSLYGTMTERGKILNEAEGLVLAAGGCVARLAALYGPGRCELLRRHLAGEPRLPGAAERVFNYLHVQDAVDALLVLAESGGCCIYPVCGESVTKAAVYARMEQLTGVTASSEDSPPGRRGGSCVALNCAAIRALGWTPRHRLAELFAGAN